MNWTVVIFVAIVLIAIVCLIKGKMEACPQCRKFFAMKEISRKTVGTRATTIDVKREMKNKNGDVVRTYTEAVPATYYMYDCIDECKNCGYRREVRRDATYRD